MATFTDRHIGPRDNDVQEMLSTIGVGSISELIDQTIPSQIRLKAPLDMPSGLSEYEYLNELRGKAKQNKIFRSYIGLGYYNNILPSVIQRNILENPGWYTAYTPYQAEIAQGRLEALLNFQTVVSDLTGMELANASLLDEGTAAAEAMIMLLNARSREQKKADANKFFVANACFPQTIDVMKTRATPLGIELVFGEPGEANFDDSYFGALVQYPDGNGVVNDYTAFVSKANASGVKVAVAADIMSLVLLTPPGEWGADVVVGTTQRFGIPLGFGGPHAAYFATKEEYKRHIPGRIIGVTVDSRGQRALRMALQTREQHIKRDRATSNICTAQVLLAVMAGMYAVYHGAEGLQDIARHIHGATKSVAEGIKGAGHTLKSDNYFDTIKVMIPASEQGAIRDKALEQGINFHYAEDGIQISMDETVTDQDVADVAALFGGTAGAITAGDVSTQNRTSKFMEFEVFNLYRSETEMMRYIKRLENKDLSLVHSMISLGSCTMKLNAASELLPLTWPGFAGIHPFVPTNQAEGYIGIMNELEKQLCEVTGFDAVSLQPNSGAQGEYAGLMVIRAYHEDHGDTNRNIALIPSSAHGTNPASAVMAGMKVVVTKCDDNGNIDVEDLRAKAEEHKDNLAALMVTYPSTHGVFEEAIMEVTNIVHENGGLVYMDGANMNAQVGLTNPATIGADVCHLNLHKTFAIPHGGGGPGMGPIGVVAKLAPYLPSNPISPVGGDKAINAISAAQYGSALVLLISYGYIKMLGGDGMTKSTEMAILNANYLKAKLQGAYEALYANEKGRVAHEMIVECRPFKDHGIEVTDIAKRLMDYGFHAPTVSFPVAGTLMVEPTESESKEELDRFVETMLSIRQEIEDVAKGVTDAEDNVLHNAPHTADVVMDDNWSHAYSRKDAAYPLDWIREGKFWPSVGRVDDAYGDRNLVCTCNPIESYMEEETVSA